jgi:leucyl-tRNA synthetase
VIGAYRFTQRLFRLVEAVPGVVAAEPEVFGTAARTLRRATHRTIATVTDALEGFAFNVAVARVYEFANAIGEAERAGEAGVGDEGLVWAQHEALRALAVLISPMMPHLAEEIWSRLPGTDGSLVAQGTWPVADPQLTAAETFTIAVQVMGKLRGKIEVLPDAAEADVVAAAEAEPNVARALEGKRIVKRVYVAGRIVNFVVAG